jgi:hypothetical protein
VAGLQNALATLRARNQVVGFGERGGQRLFHQQVETGVEQHRGDRMVMHGGNGDGGRVQLEIGGQQLARAGKDGNRVALRGLGGARRVRLDGRDQRYAQARRFQLAVDAQVILAKGSGPGNGNAQRGLAHGSGVQPCGAFGRAAAPALGLPTPAPGPGRP